jgi:hypothetical protein
MFKTLFRNDGSYGKLGVHRPRQPNRTKMDAQRWFDGAGRELAAAFHTGRIFSDYGRDNYKLVQLNHYPLGAMESYVVKCDRGRANRDASAFDMSYWVERNFSTEEDLSIAALEPRTAPLRANLHADSRLEKLHRAAVDWRHQRFQTLMLSENYRGLFGRLMMTPPSRVLTTAEHRILAGHATRAAASGQVETDPDTDRD